MEAAGWRAGPPAPSPDGTPEWVRLLKKVSWLEDPSGARYTFGTGAQGVLREDAAGCWRWSLDGDAVHIWVERADGAVDYLGRSVGEWLEGRIGSLESGDPVPPTPVVEFGHDGTGWGWRIEDLGSPSRLDLDTAEAETGSRELRFSDGLGWVGQRVRAHTPPPAKPTSAPPEDEPDLGDLFGGGSGRPQPRVWLILGLLLVGLALTVLGMLCIAAPGGLLVLLAWYFVEKDMERLESGYLPESDRVRVERVRRLTYGGLVVVVVLFTIQGLLLCNGAYDLLLDRVYIPMWQEFLRGVLGEVETPAAAIGAGLQGLSGVLARFS